MESENKLPYARKNWLNILKSVYHVDGLEIISCVLSL